MARRPRQRWRSSRDDTLDAPPPAPSRLPRSRAWQKAANRGKAEAHMAHRHRREERDRTAAKEKRVPVSPGRPFPQDLIREASYLAAGRTDDVPLRIIRATVPWQSSSGRSCSLHPLKRDDFWDHHFGRHAFALLRGPRHRVPVPMSTAKSLLQMYRVGVDADVIGPYLWSAVRRQLPGEPSLRGPAFAAVDRGRAVRLRNVNRRMKRIGRGDPLFKALARLAPGRGAALSMHWTPPGAAALPPHEDNSHQTVVQIHGARRWTVCTRGRFPSKTAFSDIDMPGHVQDAMEGKKPGLCTKVILRRGDALYLPSMVWHWTDKGASTGVHLTWDVAPLTGADLMKVLGTRFKTSEDLVPNAALGLPLPLWHPRVDDSLRGVAGLCSNLPSSALTKGAEVMCTVPLMRLALQRLGAAAGSRAGAKQRGQNVTEEEKERARAFAEQLEAERIPREKRRQRTQFYVTVARRFSEGLLLLVGIFAAIWCCCAEPDPDERQPRKKRVKSTKGQPRGIRGVRARVAAKKQQNYKYE